MASKMGGKVDGKSCQTGSKTKQSQGTPLGSSAKRVTGRGIESKGKQKGK